MKLATIAMLCLVVSCAAGAEPPALTRVEVPAPRDAASGSSVPVVFEAPVIELTRSLVRSSGGLRLISGTAKITASSATYDWTTGEGSLRDVVFTTCTATNPDYRLEARRIDLLKNHKLRAEHILLYLGRVRVLSLPWIRMRVGGRSNTTHLFPRPSYDQTEGVALAQEFLLVDTDRMDARADLRLAVRHGLQGELSNTYAIDGALGEFPGRWLTYEALRNTAMTVPVDLAPTATAGYAQGQGLSRLRQFARFSLNQRTYNVRNTGLMVYRQPEIGLQYIGVPISLARTRLDPRLETYPELRASWGLFKETPNGTGSTSRSTIAFTTGINALDLGPTTSLQPLGQVSYTRYGTDTSYTTTAYGLDISRVYRNGSIAQFRYIKRDDSGTTPFQFDRLDILQELQGGFQVQFDRHVLGFSGGYDLDAGNLYDWSVLYGYRSDCLSASIAWDWLQERVSFDVNLINQ